MVFLFKYIQERSISLYLYYIISPDKQLSVNMNMELRKNIHPNKSDCIACKTVRSTPKKIRLKTVRSTSKKLKLRTNERKTKVISKKQAACKYWKMRSINNISSKKNREKNKALITSIKEEETELKEKQCVLKEKQNNLEKQMIKLKWLFTILICKHRWGEQKNTNKKH